jgi:hypothetical protein
MGRKKNINLFVRRVRDLELIYVKYCFSVCFIYMLGFVTSLLYYADDVNLLGDNIDTIKRNTQTLIDASKEIGLEVNTEKNKYMLLSRHRNAGQNMT